MEIPTKTPIQEIISKKYEKFMEAASNGDAGTIASLYSEDAQMLPPNSDIANGKQEIQNLFQSFMDMGVKEINLESLEIEEIKNKTIEVGKYWLVGEDNLAMDNGKYIVIWKKDGEDWKLYRDIFNSSIPLQ